MSERRKGLAVMHGLTELAAHLRANGKTELADKADWLRVNMPIAEAALMHKMIEEDTPAVPREQETTFELDLFNAIPSSDELADELERTAKMVREGYREGEVMIDGLRGWWKSRAI